MTSFNSSVLVVSDDEKTRELVRSAIQAEQLDPILCGNGEEAWESIRKQIAENKFSRLIVLESFLPKLDGFELINKLKTECPSWQIPFLMLLGQMQSSQTQFQSGSMPTQSLSSKIKLKADNYLQKPFDQKEIQSAIHSMVKYFRPHAGLHPMTQLPGNPQIEKEILSRFSQGQSCSLLWIDINYFRPFNDRFGSSQGDKIIQLLSRQIKETAQTVQKNPPFLAHVNGDDFVLLIESSEGETIQSELTKKFNQELKNFYPTEDFERNFFYGQGRSDQKERVFPLMSLSFVQLQTNLEKFIHYGHLTAQTSDLMRQAKISAESRRKF